MQLCTDQDSRIPLPFDYGTVANAIDGWLPEWREMDFDAVVAIARGGLIAGTMAASGLSLPLFALRYTRSSRQVHWYTQERPPAGARVLLIEDIAGSDATLTDCHAFLCATGYAVDICTLASDEHSRIRPRWSRAIPEGCRAAFPWCREPANHLFATISDRATRPVYLAGALARAPQ